MLRSAPTRMSRLSLTSATGVSSEAVDDQSLCAHLYRPETPREVVVLWLFVTVSGWVWP